MRGKHLDSSFTASRDGITPADAGKTRCNLRHSVLAEDHPRGCGENAVLGFCCNSALGSPPRMRGKPVQPPFATCVHRITPADAGKTWRKAERNNDTEDHPRGCGENLATPALIETAKGSPPRMRGKLRLVEGSSYIDRITPADAGKTQTADDVHGADRDHPRGCGENIVEILFESKSKGSPPRMRGKQSIWTC